jgi:hypothetical protein
MVMVGGCVDGAVPEAPDSGAPVTMRAVRPDDVRAVDPPAPDVCALAAQLADDNICSLICEPDVMEAQLIADGWAMGTCYEFACVLPDASSVTVGACLPPPPS